MNFIQFSEKALSPVLNRKGAILYSAWDTLVKGDIYILGTNPGGNPDTNTGPTIGDDLKALPSKKDNKYIDECWYKNKGQHPLQRNIACLVSYLGYDLDKVCASNFVFMQSSGVGGINSQDAGTCWPVHIEILKIVQPKLILAFGVALSKPSAYRYLRERLNIIMEDDPIPSGHGDWKCCAFKGQLPGTSQSFWVAGLPHMSRYNPCGKEKEKVIGWLKSKLG